MAEIYDTNNVTFIMNGIPITSNLVHIETRLPTKEKDITISFTLKEDSEILQKILALCKAKEL